VYRARRHGFGRPRTLRVGPARLRVAEKRLYFDRRGNAYVLLASAGAQRRLPNGRYEITKPAGIFLATRRPRGHFHRPQRVSPAGVPASQPDLAIGPDGTVVAVWRRSETGGPEDLPGPIEAAVRPPQGRFGPPQTLTSAQFSNAISPHVVIIPTGEAVAAWQVLSAGGPSECGDCAEIDVSMRSPGGSFGTGQPIAPQQIGIDRLSLAGTERGDVFAVWQQLVTPDEEGAVSAMRPPGGMFTTAQPISSSPAGLVTVASCGNRVAALVTPHFPLFEVVTRSVEPG
jgi:hypothetical protein